MYLKDWIAERGDSEEMVFQSVNKGRRITGGRLSGEALRKMSDKHAAQAELSQAITWHDFRRSFAGNLWGAGVDGVVIQKLMGHVSQNQTANMTADPQSYAGRH